MLVEPVPNWPPATPRARADACRWSVAAIDSGSGHRIPLSRNPPHNDLTTADGFEEAAAWSSRMFASEEAAEGNATCGRAVDSQTRAARLRLMLAITVVTASSCVNVEHHHVVLSATPDRLDDGNPAGLFRPANGRCRNRTVLFVANTSDTRQLTARAAVPTIAGPFQPPASA